MSESRELLSSLDRAQLYTIVEIAILAAGFAGTLITQNFWVAVIAFYVLTVFSRFISHPISQSVEDEI